MITLALHRPARKRRRFALVNTRPGVVRSLVTPDRHRLWSVLVADHLILDAHHATDANYHRYRTTVRAALATCFRGAVRRVAA